MASHQACAAAQIDDLVARLRIERLIKPLEPPAKTRAILLGEQPAIIVGGVLPIGIILVKPLPSRQAFRRRHGSILRHENRAPYHEVETIYRSGKSSKIFSNAVSEPICGKPPGINPRRFWYSNRVWPFAMP